MPSVLTGLGLLVDARRLNATHVRRKGRVGLYESKKSEGSVIWGEADSELDEDCEGAVDDEDGGGEPQR